jgi:hypothetical protein
MSTNATKIQKIHSLISITLLKPWDNAQLSRLKHILGNNRGTMATYQVLLKTISKARFQRTMTTG